MGWKVSKFAPLLPGLLALEENNLVRVPVAEGYTLGDYARKLRQFVAMNRQLYRWKWAIRVDGDTLTVRKRGVWLPAGEGAVTFKLAVLCKICGKRHARHVRTRTCKVCGLQYHTNKKRQPTCSKECAGKYRGFLATKPKPTPEEMPLCACGCGKQVRTLRSYTMTYKSGETVKAGDPCKFLKGHRIAKMGRCLHCGKDFKLQQRKYACSRTCSNALGYRYRRIDKKPWEIRPDRWKRVKCAVCRRFKWRQKHEWHMTVCSVSCRQKRTAQRWRKVPTDKEMLAALIAQGVSCADINRKFGAHPFSKSARTAIRAVGLVPVVVPRWRTRVGA